MKKATIMFFIAVIFCLTAIKTYEINGKNINEKTEKTVETYSYNQSTTLSIGSLTAIKDISVGPDHTLVLTEDGTVYGMGTEQFGRLGHGAAGDSVKYTPVKVANNPDADGDGIDDADGGFVNGNPNDPVVGVAVAKYNSLVLTKSGLVYVFGLNMNGSLGFGENFFTAHKPYKLVNGSDFINGDINDPVVKIVAGTQDSFLLTKSGTVYVFGSNLGGLHGNGTKNQSNVPIKVENNLVSGFINGNDENPVIDISIRNTFVLILMKNGEVYVIGDNQFGQLGNGTNTAALRAVKMDLSNVVGKVVDISTGHQNTHVLTSEGIVYSVGQNQHGSLGDGTTISKNRLVRVVDNPDSGFVNNNIIDISSHGTGAALLTNTNEVYAFGYNFYGQVGDGTGIATQDEYEHKHKTKAVKLVNNASFENNGIIKIFDAFELTVLLNDKGVAYASGYTFGGKIGNGDTESRYVPAAIRIGGEPNGKFELLGSALEHDVNKIIKYSSNVEVTNLTGEISIKKNEGTFINITNSYTNATNGGTNKYIIGDNSSGGFPVNEGEEAVFTIRGEAAGGFSEYKIVIDKKPPKLEDMIGICSQMIEKIYYCNKNVMLKVKSDISGFHLITKKENNQSNNIGISNENVVDNLEFEDLLLEERSAVEYSIMDGAGNVTVITIILDNTPPRMS